MCKSNAMRLGGVESAVNAVENFGSRIAGVKPETGLPAMSCISVESNLIRQVVVPIHKLSCSLILSRSLVERFIVTIRPELLSVVLPLVSVTDCPVSKSLMSSSAVIFKVDTLTGSLNSMEIIPLAISATRNLNS